MNKIEVYHKHPWKTYPVSSFNGLKQNHTSNLYFVIDLEGTNLKKTLLYKTYENIVNYILWGNTQN